MRQERWLSEQERLPCKDGDLSSNAQSPFFFFKADSGACAPNLSIREQTEVNSKSSPTGHTRGSSGLEV